LRARVRHLLRHRLVRLGRRVARVHHLLAAQQRLKVGQLHLRRRLLLGQVRGRVRVGRQQLGQVRRQRGRDSGALRGRRRGFGGGRERGRSGARRGRGRRRRRRRRRGGGGRD